MRAIVSLLVIGLLATPVLADGPEPDKVKAAIDKGVEWLKKRQGADGSFAVEAQGTEKDAVGLAESHHLEGTTALALLTLLKCGVKPDDPIINKGFDWLMQTEPSSTYSVSLEILALEARFQPKQEQVDKEKRPYATVAHDRFAKIARPEDKQWLDDLVKWLLSKQQTSVWRYPSGAMADSNQDNSCTQYAAMALKAGARLGAEVPPETWKKVAEYFVAQQDPTGPAFDDFRVPAADGSIVAPVAPGKTADKSKTATHTMNARGFTYLPRAVPESQDGPGNGTKDKPKDKDKPDPPAPAGGPLARRTSSYGSMTCSGVAALVISKSELERDKAWWKEWGGKVDQGIRDGCAWLALHFSAKSNPGSGGWYYYYMYSVERAGVLAGTYELGKHDWYDEGATRLLELQNADGSWPTNSRVTEHCDTCFALLFLERGTIPLVKLPPKRTVTGVGGVEQTPAKK